ncbi:MAG: phosphohistidine phosphatase [Alteromonadaceae bacterium]|jgi:phosphohistidine phosphatase
MFVNFYIMRHGEAQMVAANDQSRKLTANGVAEVKQNALWLKQQVAGFDLVLASPYIRAQQTQQIVCDIVETPTRLETLDDLIPEGSAENVHDYVDAAIQLYHPQNILLVSHMPLVSYLVEEFTFEHASPIFPTAGIAHIQYEIKQMKGHFEAVKGP